MPLTIADITRLKQFSTANFRQVTCQSCETNFYTMREAAKFCSGACRQMNYRKKLQNNEEDIKAQVLAGQDLKQNEVAPKGRTRDNIFNDDELDEKIKKYTINLKQYQNGN
jgi:hypothetical protein